MKVKWQKQKGRAYWITQYISTLTWSGASTQASRTVEFTMANSPYDKDMKRPNVRLGDTITFYDDKGNKRFVGKVTNREKHSDIGTVSVTARDLMHNLISSTGSYKFKNKTPEYITRALCKDLGIKIGKLKQTKKKIPKYLPNEMTYYDMILAAYKMAAKTNGKKYMLRMNGQKLEVIEKGKIIKDFILKDNERIYDVEFEENVDSMVNKVIAYNSHNKQIGSVTKPQWITKYGPYQSVLSVGDKHNKAVKKFTSAAKKNAKNGFQGPSKTLNLEAIGYTPCISGRGVRIRDKATGMTGTYWIKSDEHTWENGIHKMKLELEFKNVMESVSYNKYQKQKSSGSSSSSTYYYTKKKTVNAVFTAYTASSGAHTANGNLANASKMLCAAPSSLPFGTLIRVKGTGTDRDNKVYKVADRGGAIVVDSKGRYHIDLLMSSETKAKEFGRRTGKIDIVVKHKKTVTSYSGSGSGKLGWPCHGTITAPYGQRRSYENHPGMDIGVPTGTAIHAAADGKVVLSGWNGGYGNCVVINHGWCRSLYGHNSTLLVRKGQKVTRGQVIAKAGSTGQSTGPHCHFEIRIGSGTTNPMNYLK